MKSLIKWYKVDGESGSGSNGNLRVLNTPQNWSLTIKCNLVLYLRHTSFLGGGSYLSVYSQYIPSPADRMEWIVSIMNCTTLK